MPPHLHLIKSSRVLSSLVFTSCMALGCLSNLPLPPETYVRALSGFLEVISRCLGLVSFFPFRSSFISPSLLRHFPLLSSSSNVLINWEQGTGRKQTPSHVMRRRKRAEVPCFLFAIHVQNHIVYGWNEGTNQRMYKLV